MTDQTPSTEDVLSRVIAELDDPTSQYPLHWLANDLRAYQAGQAARDRETAAKALRDAAADMRSRAERVTDHDLRHHRDGLETACAMLEDHAASIGAGDE